MNYKKEMIKEFNRLSTRFDLWTVFNDFLIITSTALSNVVDKNNQKSRENMYKKTIAKYNDKETESFSKLLILLTHWLEAEPKDALGELFMELNLGNNNRGQYFTPMCICKCMASISLIDIDKHMKNKGYITLDEPACGAGATVIAIALHMRDLGYNYQKQLYVNATDIDMRAVMMSYIQFNLLGIPAIVNHHNTLSSSQPKEDDKWYTLLYAINKGMININPEKKKKKVS